MRDQQQHGLIAQSFDEEAEQFLGRWVDPVRILDQDTERMHGSGRNQQLLKQDEHLGLAAARGGIGWHCVQQAERGAEQ